jgi:Uma2 family endonuclease
MSAVPKRKLTPQEYLAIERAAEFKSEYHDGEMFIMSGARLPHVTINSNLVFHLRRAFENGTCRVLANDMRIKVARTGLYTYPDTIIVCDKPVLEDSEMDTLLNPTVLFEILSKSTELYDRGTKFEHYQSIESLKEYVLVTQNRHRIERYVRGTGHEWTYSEFSDPEGVFQLGSLPASIPMKSLYEDVEFPPEAPPLRLLPPSE